MDKDEAIRILFRLFGERCFRINKISVEETREIAKLTGAETSGLHGTRSRLGKRLVEMDGYECKTAPHKGAVLKYIPTPHDRLPNKYKIQLGQDSM